MLSAFMFCICTIAFFPLCMVIKKTESKLNGYYVVCISIVVLLGIICCMGGLLSAFDISTSIQTLGGGICVCDIVLLAYMKKRKMQKYYWPAIDLIGIVVVVGIVLVISIKIYGYELALTYVNSDPAIHFGNAMDVVRTKRVSGMYFTPLINAIIIEICSVFLPVIKYYKAFILADILMHCLEAVIVYSFFSYIGGRTKKQKIISLIITILYICGYPLYSYCLGGFFHWSNAGMLFVVLLWVLILMSGSQKQNQLLTLLALISFCIVICYMPFTPMVVFCDLAALFAIYRGKNNFKKFMLPIILVMLVMLYCFWQQFRGSISLILTVMQGRGGIYGTLSSDIILFLPALLGLIYYKNTLKESGKMIIIVSMTVICTTVLAFVFCCLGVLSAYYFYKFYYILWIIGWMCIRYLMRILENKEERSIVYCSFFSVFFLSVFLSFFSIENHFGSINSDLIKQGTSSLFAIYASYNDKIADHYTQYKYPTSKLDLYNYVIEQCDYEVPLITFIDGYYDSFWFCSITGKEAWSYYEWTDTYDAIIEKLRQNNVEYMLVMYDSSLYNDNKEKIEKYSHVYENESGVIVSLAK